MKTLITALVALALPSLAHAAPSQIQIDIAHGILERDGTADPEATFRAARIGNSEYYVVYVDGPMFCGRAGCVPYIYKKKADGHFQHLGGLSVGHLPIAILPTSHNGMPDIAISEYPDRSSAKKLMPVTFANGTYSALWNDHMVPMSRGKVLISEKTPEKILFEPGMK